jgi:cytochrome c oxidase subunit 4
MSEQPSAVEHGHGHAGEEHAHPGPATYIKIGVVLFLLTVVEVVVVYVPALSAVLIPILMVLMTVKFALVVMFYMHLKFDNRLFSSLFTAPLLIAISITLALMALFGAFVVGSHGGVTGGTGGGH